MLVSANRTRRVSANGRMPRVVSSTTSSRWIGARCTTRCPASERAKRNKSSTMRVRRRDAACIMPIDSRYSASSRCGLASVTSASARTIAVGVRSSCDASAMKRRCCSNDCSSRFSKSLITRANRTSSSPPPTGKRSCNVVALMAVACSAIDATGARLRRASTYPLTAAARISSGMATLNMRRISSIVCSTSRSGYRPASR